MSPANGPSPLPELLGASLLATLSSGLLTWPRARSSAVLMYCRPVGMLNTVSTLVADGRFPVAPAAGADASTRPPTATSNTALRPRGLAAPPRRRVTAERGARTRLSLRRLITSSLPQPRDRLRARAPRNGGFPIPPQARRRRPR